LSKKNIFIIIYIYKFPINTNMRAGDLTIAIGRRFEQHLSQTLEI
jgi:hypothetical protein